MTDLLFRNVRILDPRSAHHRQVCDLRLEKGKIVEIGKDLSDEGLTPEQIKTGGCLSPGWIDMRVHLTDPGEEYKESLESLAEAAVQGGFTALVTLPNTHPVMDNHGQIKALLTRARDLPVRIWPTGSLSKGGAGTEMADLYDMHQAGAVAFTEGNHSIASPGFLLRNLQYLKAFNGLLMDLPMEADLVPGAFVAEGVSSTRTGLKGLPDLAETLPLSRNLKVLEYFPGRLHLGPLTTGKGLKLAQSYQKEIPELSLETSAFYLAYTDAQIESFNTAYKVWPPLRRNTDLESLLAAVMEGQIQVVSSNHHPQSIEEKKHDFVRAEFGAAMIEVAFSVAWRALSEAYPDREEEALDRLLSCLTLGPAQVLQKEIPTLEAGESLDLTWFDPDLSFEWTAKDSPSRAVNHPFVNLGVRGRPLGTVCKGSFKAARKT